MSCCPTTLHCLMDDVNKILSFIRVVVSFIECYASQFFVLENISYVQIVVCFGLSFHLGLIQHFLKPIQLRNGHTVHKVHFSFLILHKESSVLNNVVVYFKLRYIENRVITLQNVFSFSLARICFCFFFFFFFIICSY